MSNMRGLTVFISDLRNARARESEERRINTELAKIRGKFRETKLNGYERKKYVAKLLYMYILGWDVEFGHLEAVNLISSSKYSEKQIGYLGVTLLLHENHDLIHLVVNSIRKDLLDNNELFNCLALHCIANIGGPEIAKASAADVHRLLISPVSKSFVKKKAALSLVRLYRKHPQVFQTEWIDRILSLMDDADMGVSLSIVSLVTIMAQDQPERFSGAGPRAVRMLKEIVFDHDYESGYLYYKVPIPWLQIKLLRLLLVCPILSDALVRESLLDTLQMIISCSGQSIKNSQQSNAQNAVFFQAITLAVHVNADLSLIDPALLIVNKFLASRETNVRYLALETLSFLTRHLDLMEPMKRHRSLIMHSLNDRDISVRRRGLDLVYSMCDSHNAKEIVEDLVQYLRSSEYAMREETVLKIAILVEKFTTKLEWYIDVSLQLLAIAGDHVPEEVWQRIVQIVANNEALQEHASRSVLRYAQSVKCHENLVKVAGFILGEFGHLIANEETCSPIEQFSTLHSRFNLANADTRAILLSTYVKFVNLFPEIKSEILLVFRQFSEVLDPELQQRACEYLYIAAMPDDSLLQTLCEEMPPYPEKSSRLISKLYSGVEEPLSPVLNNRAFPNSQAAINTNEQFALLNTSLSANWEPGFQRLVWKDNGLLYEDSHFTIMVRSSYAGFSGNLVLYIKNKTTFAYTSFDVSTRTTSELTVQSANLAKSELSAQSQVEKAFDIQCLGLFSVQPILQISYFAGAIQTITLKLPITINKFLSASNLQDYAKFSAEWKGFGSQTTHAVQSLTIVEQEDGLDMKRLISILNGMRWSIMANCPDLHSEVCAAGVLQMRDVQAISVLLQIEVRRSESTVVVNLRSASDSALHILMAHLIMCLISFLPLSKSG